MKTKSFALKYQMEVLIQTVKISSSASSSSNEIAVMLKIRRFIHTDFDHALRGESRVTSALRERGGGGKSRDPSISRIFSI